MRAVPSFHAVQIVRVPLCVALEHYSHAYLPVRSPKMVPRDEEEPKWNRQYRNGDFASSAGPRDYATGLGRALPILRKGSV